MQPRKKRKKKPRLVSRERPSERAASRARGPAGRPPARRRRRNNNNVVVHARAGPGRRRRTGGGGGGGCERARGILGPWYSFAVRERAGPRINAAADALVAVARGRRVTCDSGRAAAPRAAAVSETQRAAADGGAGRRLLGPWCSIAAACGNRVRRTCARGQCAATAGQCVRRPRRGAPVDRAFALLAAPGAVVAAAASSRESVPRCRRCSSSPGPRPRNAFGARTSARPCCYRPFRSFCSQARKTRT